MTVAQLGLITSNPALNTDALHAASRHSVRRLAPRWAQSEP